MKSFFRDRSGSLPEQTYYEIILLWPLGSSSGTNSLWNRSSVTARELFYSKFIMHSFSRDRMRALPEQLNYGSIHPWPLVNSPGTNSLWNHSSVTALELFWNKPITEIFLQWPLTGSSGTNPIWNRSSMTACELFRNKFSFKSFIRDQWWALSEQIHRKIIHPWPLESSAGTDTLSTLLGLLAIQWTLLERSTGCTNTNKRLANFTRDSTEPIIMSHVEPILIR